MPGYKYRGKHRDALEAPREEQEATPAVPEGMVTIGEAMEGLLVDLEQRRDNAEGVAA